MGGRQCVKLTGNMDPMCSRTSSMTAVLAHLQSIIDQQEKLHFCSSSLAQMWTHCHSNRNSGPNKIMYQSKLNLHRDWVGKCTLCERWETDLGIAKQAVSNLSPRSMNDILEDLASERVHACVCVCVCTPVYGRVCVHVQPQWEKISWSWWGYKSRQTSPRIP